MYYSYCSVAECKEGCRAGNDPLAFFFVRRHLNVETEIGRVTSRRQCACTRQYFVHWHFVDSTFWCLAVALRQEPDQRDLCEQLLGAGLSHAVDLFIPAGTFHVHTPAVAAIFRFLGELLWQHVVKNLEVE